MLTSCNIFYFMKETSETCNVYIILLYCFKFYVFPLFIIFYLFICFLSKLRGTRKQHCRFVFVLLMITEGNLNLRELIRSNSESTPVLKDAVLKWNEQIVQMMFFPLKLASRAKHLFLT